MMENDLQRQKKSDQEYQGRKPDSMEAAKQPLIYDDNVDTKPEEKHMKTRDSREQTQPDVRLVLVDGMKKRKRELAYPYDRYDTILELYYPTDFGFDSDDIDLQKLYCGKWYKVKIPEDIGLRPYYLPNRERSLAPPTVIYFFAKRLSRSHGRIKITDAYHCLGPIYRRNRPEVCSSIPVNKFKQDVDDGFITEVSYEEVRQFGQLQRDFERDSQMAAEDQMRAHSPEDFEDPMPF